MIEQTRLRERPIVVSMSKNDTRSMNQDLFLGMTDGSNRHLAPDRGGVVEMAGPLERARVDSWEYASTMKGSFGRPDEILLDRLVVGDEPHDAHRRVEKSPLSPT